MKGLPRSLAHGKPAIAPIVKQTVKLASLALTTTDGNPAYGASVAGDFPEGNILFLGAVANLTFTKNDADIVDAWDGDFGLGTTATADGTLTTTEVDIIPSTSTVQGALVGGVAGVSAGNRGVSTTTLSGAIFDNTDGSLEINLNLLIDDADESAAGAVLVDGVIQLSYIVLLDD